MTDGRYAVLIKPVEIDPVIARNCFNSGCRPKLSCNP